MSEIEAMNVAINYRRQPNPLGPTSITEVYPWGKLYQRARETSKEIGFDAYEYRRWVEAGFQAAGNRSEGKMGPKGENYSYGSNGMFRSENLLCNAVNFF